ncbi:MAG: hypothetical protein EON60_02170 [Alphaproteobacteria bacterium]|nr:MAG: hypothetical protein EON60_02170 [Alphaproteobacteria bacterium]
MLDKLAMGLLGNAVSSVLGGFLGTDKTDKAGKAGSAGFDQILLGMKDVTAAEELGINTKDKVSAGTEEGLSLLREMTSGGIEGYFKYMIKELREKVMEDMGVSEADLAAMDPAQRDVVEKAIEDAVKEKVAEAMGIDKDKVEQAMADMQGGGITEIMARMEAGKAYKNKQEII